MTPFDAPLRPNAIIATWHNEPRTRGYMLQADGTLIMCERDLPGDAWSPPIEVGKPDSAVPTLEQMFHDLTGKILPRPRPDFDPRVDYPERYSDGPY